MEGIISLTDALQIIDAVDANGVPVPFNISFRSLNRNSKTGGKLYEYNQVVKLVKKKALVVNFLKQAQATRKEKKHANHFFNRTRNLELQNGDIKKIHIRLIISINGLKVIY